MQRFEARADAVRNSPYPTQRLPSPKCGSYDEASLRLYSVPTPSPHPQQILQFSLKEMLETSEQNILCLLDWRTLKWGKQQDSYHQGMHSERDSTFTPARNCGLGKVRSNVCLSKEKPPRKQRHQVSTPYHHLQSKEKVQHSPHKEYPPCNLLSNRS